MKTDAYTKIVLTVIAVALVIIVFQNTSLSLVEPANAASLSENSLNSSNSSRNIMDVNIVSIDGRKVSTSVWGILRVHVENYRDFK